MDIAGILARWPELWDRLHESLTYERAAHVFMRLADTPAPSQLARHTRGRVIEDMLQAEPAFGEAKARYSGNVRATGTVALETGHARRKQLWLITHLDTISYAIHRKEGNRYRLMPLCYHQIKSGRRPGLALQYLPATKSLHVASVGDVVTEAEGREVFFETTGGDLPPGVRIAYQSSARVNWETLALEGNIDNAFACAAAYLAMVFLGSLRNSETGASPEILAAFPDEEEGVISPGNQAFCRGSARLFHRMPMEELPDFVMVSDVHEAGDMADGPGASGVRMGGGATFSEVASWGKGGVVPPPILAFQRELATFLGTKGIRLRENRDGYLSRSDDVSAMMYTPNIALIGFLGTHRHFDEGPPQANLGDLVHLAKTFVVYSLVAHDEQWRTDYLT